MTNLNKTSKAIIEKIAASVTDLQKQVEKNEAKMSQIDEEYRQKAEQKKAALQAETTELKNDIEFWNKAIKDKFGAGIDELLCDKDQPKATADTPVESPELFETQETSEQPDTPEPPENPVDLNPGMEISWEDTPGQDAFKLPETEDESPEIEGFTASDNNIGGDDSADTEEEPQADEDSEWPSDFPNDWE